MFIKCFVLGLTCLRRLCVVVQAVSLERSEEWAAGAGVRVSTRPGIPDQHPARGDTGSPATNQRPGEGELGQSEASMITDGESINPSIGRCHLSLCLQLILFVFRVINSKTRGKQEINTEDKHNHKMRTITRQLGWPDNTSVQGSSTATLSWTDKHFHFIRLLTCIGF